MTCYKSGSIRISFRIPKELFDSNNMFEYQDVYLEATIEKNTNKTEIVFSTYANENDEYSVGDRPGITYYWIKIHNKKMNTLPKYVGKPYVIDEKNRVASMREKGKESEAKRNGKSKRKKESEEPKQVFNTPYLKPEPVKTNLCRHPSSQRTGHNQKVAPTKVYLGGKFS